MTDVLLVTVASVVVLSTFSPFTSSSTPKSSTNAPLVPDPSSREMTLMLPPEEDPPSLPPSLSLLPHAARDIIITAAVIIAVTFLNFIVFSP